MKFRKETKETEVRTTEENRGNWFSPPGSFHETRAKITFWVMAFLITCGVSLLAVEDGKNKKLQVAQVCMELRQAIDSLGLNPKERELLCSTEALKQCVETCMDTSTETEQQPETQE